MVFVDSSMLGETLALFNLSKTEVELVLELANRGAATINTLVRASGRHRGTVYNCLNQLIHKGFVSMSPVGNKTYYSINESAFLGAIEQQQKQIETMKKCAKQIKMIKKVADEVVERPSMPVTVSYGNTAYKNMLTNMFQESVDNDRAYLTYCNGGEMRDILGDVYYQFSQRLKQHIGADCRVLLSESKLNHPFAKEVVGNIRWAQDIIFPAQGLISGDSLVIVDWESSPINYIEIRNKNIVASYRDFFRSIWKRRSVSGTDRMH